MLRDLHIRNYAIIRELDISFDDGLITLTGETGAGKSILLGALSLILGQRADTAVLQDKNRKCVIEGTFLYSSDRITKLLRLNDLDEEEELVIRREIADSGKSRAFVNDTPVNLSLLKELGSSLVDIHSQHENLDLAKHQYQMDVIDAFGNLMGERDLYSVKYHEYRDIRAQAEKIEKEKQSSVARLDYIRFQLEELEKARLTEDEYLEIEQEIEILQHSEEIKTCLFNTWNTIDGAEDNVVKRLREVMNDLKRISRYFAPAARLADRMDSMLIEIRDIASEADSHAEKTEHDPGRQQFIEDRLNTLNSLMQKHSARDMSELIAIRDSFIEEISGLENMEFRLEELYRQLSGLEKELETMASELSRKRKDAASGFRERIVELLVQLGIANARFDVSVNKTPDPGEYGYDLVRFLFSANKNSQLQELAKVASGGEMSRLMLSIKSVISHIMGLPSIIFDEIDTGVSGEIAHRVGRLMKEMSSDRQVFAVTHLPQVAASGNQHYYVYKEDLDGATETRLKKLSRDERIIELAKMLSGEQTTDAAIENAKELLGK